MSTVERLEEEVKQVRERMLKVETYFKVGFVVAVVFGIAGSFGANLISKINEKIQVADTATDKVIAKINISRDEAIGLISEKENLSVSAVAASADTAVQEALTIRVPEVKQWPDGTYCILRGNASCPANFNQIDGHIWAMSVYDKSSTYVKPSIFGASKIGLHSNGAHPKWYGDINLSVCCK